MPGSRGRGRRSRGPSVKSLMRHAFNGVKFRPGPNPPPTVETPWNQMTLSISSPGQSTVAGSTIAKGLLKQAGFGDSTLGIDIRVLKVRAWSLKIGNVLRVRMYGFDNTKSATGGAIQDLVDFPSVTQYACLGYEYPAALKNIVYSSDSTDKIMAVECAGEVLLYIDVLWRGNQYVNATQTVRGQLTSRHQYASSSSFSLGSLETEV